MALCVLIIAFSLPRQSRFKYEYEKGQVWLNPDLISPYSFAIQKTYAEIQKDRESILKSVFPVYQNDTETPFDAYDAFAAEYEIKWQNSGQKATNTDLYLKTGLDILKDVYRRGVLTMSKKFQRNSRNYVFTLLTNNVAQQLNTTDVFRTKKR